MSPSIPMCGRNTLHRDRLLVPAL